MEMYQLVCLEWISEEREKYFWEDLYNRDRPWDELLGRMYLLKANDEVRASDYKVALADFEQAVAFLAKQGVDPKYQTSRFIPKRGVDPQFYARALTDKAIVQCLLQDYDAALATINQALAVGEEFYESSILLDRGSILVLAGSYSEALHVLSTQLEKKPKNSNLRFTLATCLLHLERYDEAVVAYEQVMAEGLRLGDEGLIAARRGQQPDWENL